MRNLPLLFASVGLGTFLTAHNWGNNSALEAQPALTWAQLPPLPNKLGVAAPFAGVSGDALLVAGGANFPGRMPWEGGQKVWHDEVYALSDTNRAWQLVGHLPRPLAYGVAVTLPDGVLCIGGSDAAGHRSEVFELQWRSGRLAVEPREPLPLPLAQACGAVAGDTVYVACGATEPGEHSATNRVFTASTREGGRHWREIAPFPGQPRILPVAAALGDTFYLAGGAALEPMHGRVPRVYLCDAWSFQPGRGWKRIADLPKPAVGAPSPAPALDSQFLVVGGDDGSLAGFQPVENHPGFPNLILLYDARQNTWRTNGATPAPRATTPVVRWHDRFVMPSGELRPGVRSPQVWTLRLGTDK